MRILHTESSMNLGGQELRTLMEMEELMRYGFTSILAARPSSRIVEEGRRRRLRVYEVPMRGSFDPPAVIRFAWIIRKERVDLVSAHGSKDGWSAGLAARILGRKVVRSRNVANPIRSHPLGRFVYTSLCDAIVTTSEFIKQGMVERGVPAGKITCVPTGVDVESFHTSVERGRLRANLGIDAHRPLVGMVSALRGDNGPDLLILAAEHVVDDQPEVFFVLTGDGWMRDALEATARCSPHSSNIRLTGFRRDIPQVMADLNLMVLPARIPGGIPQTILQAHAMQVPVIASDLPGINEVALDGETALLVPPGDPRALAEAILSVLKDPQGAARRAKKGCQLVHQDYTRERMLEKMTRIYRAAAV